MTTNDRIGEDDRSKEDYVNTPIVRPIPKTTSGLVKPVAMKVVRPIPQRVSEQFYREAFESGLNLQETSNAAALANDWHRKWTQQDEQNHTTPEADFYDFDVQAQDQLEIDRQGARNPSLIFSQESGSDMSPDAGVKRALNPTAAYIEEDENDFVLFNPEDRLSASSWSENSETSSLSSHMAPQVKRRFVGVPVPLVEEEDDRPVVAPVGVRPLAIRPSFVRPTVAHAASFEQNHGVPKDIMMMRRYGNVSPMSFSGDFVPQSPKMTVINSESDIVNVVEDDESACLSDPMAELGVDITAARDEVLRSLAVTHGDVESPKFTKSLEPLAKYFSHKELDTRPHLIHESESVEGMWLTLSKPSFFGCLGENDDGDPMYTLGRMSFDMFSPTNLVCSLQGNFNPVEVVDEEQRKAMLECVPKALREEVESGKTVLRTYHVVAAFTIEPSSASFADAPNKDVHRPIKGIMTTYGYSLPDPEVPNRHSIWFTGGRIEPNNNPSDISEWKRLFTLNPPRHSFGEKAKLLAVKLLMGATIPESMNEDGSLEYTFTRPLGGHGMAYVDVIYLDETLRIVRGQRGTVFVFSRLPQKNQKLH